MKGIIISICISLALIGGVIYMSRKSGSVTPLSYTNVSIVDGKQIIDLTAFNGFSPERTGAHAGIPTLLRVTTKGTFDCSSVIAIPSLQLSKVLPQSGVTDIDIGTQTVGTLHGTCGMGMYPFEIVFSD